MRQSRPTTRHLPRAAAPVVALAAAAGIAATSLVGAPATAGPGGSAERAAASASAAAVTPATLNRKAPLVYGHRGASGYRPEHTLAAYQLAIEMGADYIEPDLVSTKDGVLVARHENEIGGTTDVADHPEFADRQTTKTIDGVPFTGWFTEDFTLAELKTLRAKERLPLVRQESTIFDGRYEVPTLQEVVDLTRAYTRRTGRRVGIIPETKHPTYFDSIGLSLEEPLVRLLKRNGLNDPTSKVIVQSFETANLKELNTKLQVRLVQLLSGSGQPYDVVAAGGTTTYADLITPTGLAGVRRYADILGPEKGMVIPRTADGSLGTPTALVANAHAVKLSVVPYTFRAENQFLPTDLRSGADLTDFGDVIEELETFFALGVDGVFADQPDVAVAARNEFFAAK